MKNLQNHGHNARVKNRIHGALRKNELKQNNPQNPQNS